jgi:hypothetical protein
MPDSAVRTFTDPDAYNAALRDVQAQGVVTGRGNFRAELATVRLDRLSLQRTQESLEPHIPRSIRSCSVLSSLSTRVTQYT